jgi:hypothetical protein
MTTVLIIFAIVVVLFVMTKFRIARELEVKMASIPAIFERLQATGKDSSFAVLGFLPPGKTSVEDDGFNVQFSIEGSRPGFDWCLIAPANIRDKEKFVQFAGRLGYKVVEREMNKVKYLRVEDGNLPKLCEAVIHDLYSVSPDADLYFNPDGFTWP